MATTTRVKADAKAMTEAAQTFLASLTPEQREKATFAFEDSERWNWHYVPRPRKGLPRGEMSEAQLVASEVLMASAMSERGLRQANAIFELETILKGIEQRNGTLIHRRDPGLYFFCVFGTPVVPFDAAQGKLSSHHERDKPWGWRVDGHHVSLNFTVSKGEVISTTPLFLGSNPAEVLHGPHQGQRILRDEEDLARKLLLSLDAGQRARAVIYPVAPRDLFTRASRRVEIAKPAGLPASAMSADQRETLGALLKNYAGRCAQGLADAALRKLERDGFERLHFAWAGSEHRRQPHYYRIHGLSFFVEYDNTQDMANHIHSVWRDTEADLGADALAAHYAQAH
jgi:hypothetical protein